MPTMSVFAYAAETTIEVSTKDEFIEALKSEPKTQIIVFLNEISSDPMTIDHPLNLNGKKWIVNGSIDLSGDCRNQIFNGTITTAKNTQKIRYSRSIILMDAKVGEAISGVLFSGDSEPEQQSASISASGTNWTADILGKTTEMVMAEPGECIPSDDPNKTSEISSVTTTFGTYKYERDKKLYHEYTVSYEFEDRDGNEINPAKINNAGNEKSYTSFKGLELVNPSYKSEESGQRQQVQYKFEGWKIGEVKITAIAPGETGNKMLTGVFSIVTAGGGGGYPSGGGMNFSGMFTETEEQQPAVTEAPEMSSENGFDMNNMQNRRISVASSSTTAKIKDQDAKTFIDLDSIMGDTKETGFQITPLLIVGAALVLGSIIGIAIVLKKK